jgi:hypothetical protein
MTFSVWLLTNIMAACADDATGTEQPPLLSNSPGDAETAAEATLHSALKFDSAVVSAFGRVKDDLSADQFALFDAIHSELQEGIIPNDHIVDRAARELLEQMQMTDRYELAANAFALVSRFSELFSLTRESIPTRRLAQYLDDSIAVSSEMEAFLRWSDDEERKQAAYYFAPAYNFIESTHIFALGAAGYVRSTIEGTLADSIATNQHLVGGGEADEPGYLNDWVVAQTPGSANASKKLDSDPIIYSIRRSLAEQQQALE